MKIVLLLLLLPAAAHGFYNKLFDNQWVNDQFVQPLTHYVRQEFNR